ncbi:MAG: hypothetical protein CMF36_00670 [Leeuwenhoekiella sp.]|nr:hypothetical protein [Leeuwenhoekiella sp.]MBA79625.1 hypothetical protein [Leeuwenhoekiella sp.]
MIEETLEQETNDLDPPVISAKSFEIISGLKIYDETLLELDIQDEGSGIARVEVLIDEEKVYETDALTNIKYLLKPEELAVGKHKLALQAFDVNENKAKEEVDFEVIRRFVSLEFPDYFTREGTDEVYILLSDSEGNLLSQFRHNDIAETIDITLERNITENEEFMLTFVEVFDESLYDFTVYANLSVSTLGKKITFTKRSLPFNYPKFFDFEVPFYNPDFYLRASGDDYSAVFVHNKFSGHQTQTLPNGEEGAEQLFVQYHNTKALDSYRYGYFENFHEKTGLLEEDLKKDVTHGRYRIKNNRATPALILWGFEDSEHFNRFSGHMVYTNYSTPRLIDDDTFFYSYPTDLFSHYLYDIKLSNFNKTGLGKPEIVEVPQEQVNYNLSSPTSMNFFGIDEYELGRLRISVDGSNPSHMNFVFDGTSTQVIVPKLPSDIIPERIASAFNSGNFNILQGAAEDNETFDTYKDYIKNVFVTSKPFLLSSPSRKRIFKSSISHQLLPIREFPYNFSL